MLIYSDLADIWRPYRKSGTTVMVGMFELSSLVLFGLIQENALHEQEHSVKLQLEFPTMNICKF